MSTNIPIDQIPNSPPETDGSGQGKSITIKSARANTVATGDDNVNFSEPSSPTHPRYPNNNAQRTASGHVREMDDTPGAERIFEMHRSGTFYEIHPDGTKVTKIFGDDFEIVLSDNHILIGGHRNVTINGDCNLLVKGNVREKIGGSKETIVFGDLITRVTGKIITYAKGDIDIQSAGNITTLSKLSTIFKAKAGLTAQADGSASLLAGGNATVWAGGNAYINGHAESAVKASTEGTGTANSKPKTEVVKNKDPGPGLIIPDSLCDPSIEMQKAVRTDNNAVISTPITEGITFPKDRTKSTS